jgi:riboflavin biosynthesis pyrimidine reductase
MSAATLTALSELRASRAPSALPFVTLTYAQSVDGSLAAARGAPTALSGAESLALTHALRASHAGILVGVGTALADDPSLTLRLCAGESPAPVVVDARLRLPPRARLLALASRDGPRRPVILHAPFRAGDAACGDEVEWRERAAALAAAGARLVEVPLAAAEGSGGGGDGDHLDLAAALRTLAAPPLSLDSVMVEGGARLLASLVAQHLAAREPLVSAVIVTLAPMLLPGGVHVGATRAAAPAAPLRLDFRAVERVGPDVVLFGVPLIGTS